MREKIDETCKKAEVIIFESFNIKRSLFISFLNQAICRSACRNLSILLSVNLSSIFCDIAHLLQRLRCYNDIVIHNDI